MEARCRASRADRTGRASGFVADWLAVMSSFRGYRGPLGFPIWPDAVGEIAARSWRMTMFYIIGVVVVVLVIAGFLGLR